MTDVPPFGYMLLPRQVFDEDQGDPLWHEKRARSKWEAWIDVIQLAAWKKSRYPTGHGVVELNRGEFVASRRYLARRWRWTEKAVRVWLANLQKGARIRAQRDEQAGTVYLIVKYDYYQSPEAYEGRKKGPANGQAGAQQGPKIEAVKAVRTKKPSAAGAAGSGLDVFPKADCDAAHDRWVLKLGAVEYPRFRKALLPVFRVTPRRYTAEELCNAIDAFEESRSTESPEWWSKWHVNKFASELPRWVQLGGMELFDNWGAPTERGRALKVFAA